MSLSYPMTKNSFEGKLDCFKRRVDTALQIVAEASAIDAVQVAKEMVAYKKVGGLHFAKVGDASVSWSFKKKPAKIVIPPVAPQAATSDLLTSRMQRFVK